MSLLLTDISWLQFQQLPRQFLPITSLTFPLNKEPLSANILQWPGHGLCKRMNARGGWIGDVERTNSKGKRITLFQPSWQQIVNGIQMKFNPPFIVKDTGSST